MRHFLTLALVVSVFCTAFSQDRQAEKAAQEALAEQVAFTLKMDGLIVEIPTNARKIAAMKEVLETGDLTAQNRSRLGVRLATTIEETEEQAALLVKIFGALYDLGPLYFMPDTALAILQKEQPSGYFYDAALKIDPSITLPDDFVLLRMGYADAATGSGADAMLLTNRDLAPLQSPFPSAITFNNVGYLFNKLLAPDIAERKRLETAVNSLVRKLRAAIGE
ncbi:hypothetical protein [Lewinella cohaerens]|uniref:hypothetical protein n=1 Tax=Lewinella cohaerens TaxID=70995 RepID=UPI0003816440|nr:hypothetical protein [Lewinella cohaerens]